MSENTKRKVFKKALLIFTIYYLIGIILVIYKLAIPIHPPPCPPQILCMPPYIPSPAEQILRFFGNPISYLLLLGWPLFMFLSLI